MEYIFKHEKLRNDEVIHRITVKNSFFPQRLLRNNNRTLRRSTNPNRSHNLKGIPTFKNHSQVASKTPMISIIPDFLCNILQQPAAYPASASNRDTNASQLPYLKKKKSSRESSLNLTAYIPTVIYTN